jgi:hypothetical protein
MSFTYCLIQGALALFRVRLLENLQTLVTRAKSLVAEGKSLTQELVVNGSAMLRLYTALRGIAGLKSVSAFSVPRYERQFITLLFQFFRPPITRIIENTYISKKQCYGHYFPEFSTNFFCQ